MLKIIVCFLLVLSSFAHSESCSNLNETSTFEVCIFDILEEIKKVNASIQESPIRVQSAHSSSHRLDPNEELLREYKFNFFQDVSHLTLSLKEDDESVFESREELYSILTEILTALSKIKESESSFMNRSSTQLHRLTDGFLGQAQSEDLIQSKRDLAQAMMKYYKYSQGEILE